MALLQSSLPGLPADRAASESTVLRVNGSDTFDRGIGARTMGTSLDLIATADRICWAIWQINPGDEFPLQAEVELSSTTRDGAYIAVADYYHGCWKISGPFAGTTSLLLDPMMYQTAGSGNLYIAVIVAFSNLATVEYIHGVTDPHWTVTTIDFGPEAGRWSSLAVVDGMPAISYGGYHNSLNYARATTATGETAADWQYITVDNSGLVGYYTSLAVINGKPAISYYDSASGDLKFARSNTPSGANAGDWYYLTVDSAGDVGVETSLAEVDGRPAISYIDRTTNDVKYAISSTPDGASATDWQTLIIDDMVEDGHPPEEYEASDTSLLVVSGRPAVSYGCIDASGWGPVRYAHAATADGATSTDWSVLHASDLNHPGDISMAVVDGHPAIASSGRAGSEPQLWYARSNTQSGDGSFDWPSSGSHVTVPGCWGSYSSLAFIVDTGAGKSWPAIASPTSGKLYYSRAINSTGTADSDWLTDQIGVNIKASHISLTTVANRPAMSFNSFYGYHLSYAIRMGD